MKYCSSRYSAILAVALCVFLGACAGIERPVAELSSAETSIAQAERSGGQEYGAAALASAREKYAAARAAEQNGNYEVAQRLANEAALDARLASVQAERGKSQAALNELNQSLETLRRETAPGSI